MGEIAPLFLFHHNANIWYNMVVKIVDCIRINAWEAIHLRSVARILILAVITTLFTSFTPCSAANDSSSFAPGERETLSSLNAKGIRIKWKSYTVEFAYWGTVHFVTGIDTKNRHELCIYLTDTHDKVLYTFPLAEEIRWRTCDEVRAVAFTDVDKDGLADVIVIGIYNTGVNITKNRFYAATVYFQKEKEFINDPDLDMQINRAHKNRTIDMVLEFFEGRF